MEVEEESSRRCFQPNRRVARQVEVVELIRQNQTRQNHKQACHTVSRLQQKWEEVVMVVADGREKS